MNTIIVKSSHFQFKSPVLGQPSRAVKEHYYARRVVAIVNDEERQFRFLNTELEFEATEDDLITAIEEVLQKEKAEKPIEEQPTNAE